jgi:FtsZ-binding cell division protein ZapB
MDPSSSASPSQETDALLHLEERIVRAVELVANLRAEKQSLQNEKAKLLSEKETLEAGITRAQEAAESLRGELNALREERQQVKSRIERLLGQMDSLSAS